MRPLRSLLIYLVAVFLGGALIAPWLYFLVQAVAPHSGLARLPFHRYLDRSLLGLALIGLWPLVRVCGLASWSKLGMVDFKGHVLELVGGFALGFGSLAFLLLIARLSNSRALVFPADHLGKFLFGAVAAAVSVSLLEELLFRGALFGLLRQSMDWRGAASVSSVVYALAHFLQKADLPGPVTWKSGLDLLPLLFRNLTVFHLLLPALLNLTVVGLALAVAYQRTGALYGSMGLHGGWIFFLKFFQLMTQPVPQASVAAWGGDSPLNGWIILPLLAIVLVVVCLGRPPKPHV